MDTKNVIVGIDVGGTKIHGALYAFGVTDSVPEQIADQRVSTDLSRGIESVLEQVVEMGSSLILRAKPLGEVAAMGVGFPGPIDVNSGMFYRKDKFNAGEGVPVKAMLKDHFDIPIAVDNDANCFVLAEHAFGPARGCMHLLGFTLGTGLGSGIIINGKPFRGARGFGAEMGHTFFGDTAQFEDLIASKGQDDLRGRYLGIFLANAVRIFNPDAITFGGGIIEKRHAELLPLAWEGIRSHCPERYWEKLQLHASVLPNPCSLGAAVLARDSILF